MFGKKEKKISLMTRQLNMLIVVCSVFLVLVILGALFFTIRGNFKLMGVCALCAAVVFSMLVVLFKERRVTRIMNEDTYDQEQTPM